jgi:hypothetical protein
MKMGEYEAWMNELSTVSGCSRDLLDKTPSKVLFAFKVAIEERNTARERAEKLARDLRKLLPGDTMLNTLLQELGYT